MNEKKNQKYSITSISHMVIGLCCCSHSAPNYGASLNVEKIWESRVPHKVVVNPFDNTPNTDGFFN
jgi:hypothetical protein